MKVLIACEESQAVCKAFRERGHEAYSCDVKDCSGGHPEWHIKGDVLPLLKEKWDLIIAHPPCTYLTVSGNRWFNVEKYGEKALQRERDREDGAAFFMEFVNADCKRIAIENPVGCMSRRYRKPDQIIQPWQFGHPYTKQTCLWLKGLPPLVPTKILQKPPEGWQNQLFTGDRYSGFNTKLNGKVLAWNDPRTKEIRSKTFQGIADAMADQWGGLPIQLSLFKEDE